MADHSDEDYIENGEGEEEEEYVDTEEDEKDAKKPRLDLLSNKKHQDENEALTVDELYPPPPPEGHPTSLNLLAPSSAPRSTSSTSGGGRRKRTSAAAAADSQPALDDQDGNEDDEEEDEDQIAEILLKYHKSGQAGSDEDETLHLQHEWELQGKREISLEEVARKKKLAEMASMTAWAISQTNARGATAGGMARSSISATTPGAPLPLVATGVLPSIVPPPPATGGGVVKEKKTPTGKKSEEKQNFKRELGELICARLDQVLFSMQQQQGLVV